MSQLKTKFIENNAVTAAKLGSGSATSTQTAFADGSGNVVYRSIVSGDLPDLSGLYLKLTGGTMSGAINMGTSNISNAGTISATQLNVGTDALPITETTVGGLDSFTAVLLHFDNNLTDSSSNAYTVSSSGSSPSYVTGEFSQALNTTATLAYLSADPFDLSSQNFTIDFWLNNTGAGGNPIIPVAAGVQGVIQDWALYITTAGVLQWWNGTTNVVSSASSVAPQDSAWHHYAIVRNGSVYTVYLDGFNVASVTTATTPTYHTGQQLSIGGDYNNGAYDVNGAVDEFRVSLGVARWTSNFTPPVVPYGGSSVPAISFGTNQVVSSAAPTTTNSLVNVAYISSLTTLPSLLLPTTQLSGAITAAQMLPLATNDIYVGNGSNQAAAVAMSGDATIASSGALTLASVNSNIGSFGSASSVATFTVNAKGLLTAASSTSIAISGSQVSGGTFGAIDGSALTNLSAAVLSGILPVGVTGGSGLSIATSQLTGDIDLTSQVSGILPIANGGTNALSAAAAYNNLSPMTTAGDIEYEASDGVADRLAIGSTGQVLTVVSGLPAWAAATVSPSSITLTDNHILVGNASNLATDVAMSGDATIVTSGALTLATVNTNVGSFGGASSVPSFTVNAKGLLTAASATAVVAPAGTLSGTTLNGSVVTSSLTSVGTIATGVWQGTAIDIAHGGTGQTAKQAAFDALSPLGTAGDLLYFNGTHNVALGVGTTGQIVTVVSGEPAWASPAAAASNGKDTFVLSGTDITNQFVTLTHTPLANSVIFSVQGGGNQLEGSSYDYTVSGATIVFQNDLATGGVSALVATDVVQVLYKY